MVHIKGRKKMIKVSVIVPAHNEEKHITRCLDSLLKQDFPKEDYEVIVVDGMSRDGTREILKKYKRFKNLKILDNPQGLTPYALNIGISHSRGSYIARVDAHAYVEKDYLKEGVQFLDMHPDIDVVGGSWRPRAGGTKELIIGIAMCSFFGTGGGLFRCSEQEGFVDTLSFGIYRKSVFDKIGFFSPDLAKNQDDEFHLRLRRRGGKIYLSNKIKGYYTPRNSYKALFRRYFGYGLFRPKVIKMHKKIAVLRHLIPPIFVLTFITLFSASFFSGIGRILFLLLLVSYLGAGLTFTFLTSRKRGKRRLYLLPAFWAMHFGYGLGFLFGFLKLKRRGIK